MKTAREKELSRFLDGELPPRQAEKLRSELAADPELQQTLQSWQTIREILSNEQVPTVQTAEAGWADVQRALRKDPHGGEEATVFGSRLAWAAGMIAIVLLASFGWFTLQEGFVSSAWAEQAVEVEWVETQAPGSTPMVYHDEATGLTVIWMVESDEMEANDAGS